MCVNNESYVKEQMRYLNALYVPEGYEIDVLTIWEAKSMTAGYNEGMRSTDAKYKVYLHQDVFIVNKNFLQDILNIFTDSGIGMIGMVGVPVLPENGIMWNDERVGMLYFNMNYQSGASVIGEIDGECAEVDAIDGLLMATQYDIPWREDLFQNWDFYDISQSQEFIRAGYKVVVPNQGEPWCIHDDGFMNLKNYFFNRKKFIAEYKKS